MKNIEWKTEKRKINDLIPLNINPRKISDEKNKILIKSINKFNLVEIPVINKDNIIISGHQRIFALKLIERGEEIIDVRVPNRHLSKKEIKEYNLISNTHVGEWDLKILEMQFEDINIDEWKFDIPGFDLPIISNQNDLSDKIQQKFIVEIECKSEKEQEKIYNELINNGYQCRLLIL